MATENKNEPRKLSNEEMEGAKGGSTFASLSTFSVNSSFSTSTSGSIVRTEQTVMCGGQTRALHF